MVCDIGEREIIAVSDEIWASMLNITLQPGKNVKFPLPGEACVTATVEIFGAWDGLVRLDFSKELATAATAIFLGVGAGEVQLDEVRDSSGELANITAGAMKALLPSPSHLGLPSVIEGRDYSLTVQNGTLLVRTPFICENGKLVVSLFARATGTGR